MLNIHAGMAGLLDHDTGWYAEVERHLGDGWQPAHLPAREAHVVLRVAARHVCPICGHRGAIPRPLQHGPRHRLLLRCLTCGHPDRF